MKQNIKSILFITYDSINAPILQSQGLPLLRNIAEKGYKCGIVTYEIEKKNINYNEKNIKWYPIKQKISPVKPQSLLDIIQGFLVVFGILLKEQYSIIHCRSYIAGLIGLINSIIFHKKCIFDMRGLYPDEYVISGYIQKDSWLYNFYKCIEHFEIKLSSNIIVVSYRFNSYVKRLYFKNKNKLKKIEVIPSCVDLQKFKFNQKIREKIRKQLNINQKLVFVYAGSLAEWHLWKTGIDFFNVIKKNINKAFYLFLTYEDIKIVDKYFKGKKIHNYDYKILHLSSPDVPPYLMAADYGIMFITTDISKQVCSPIKFAEYLACGLPVIANYGIGDTSEIIKQNNVGITYKFDELKDATIIWNKFENFQKKYNKNHCIQLAKKEFSLDIAIKKYSQVYGELLNA